MFFQNVEPLLLETRKDFGDFRRFCLEAVLIFLDSKGKAVDENKLMDWDKQQAPAGLIQEKNDKGNGGNSSKGSSGTKDTEQKLNWDKLCDYLGH